MQSGSFPTLLSHNKYESNFALVQSKAIFYIKKNKTQKVPCLYTYIFLNLSSIKHVHQRTLSLNDLVSSTEDNFREFIVSAFCLGPVIILLTC